MVQPGAGAVLAGVISPASAESLSFSDNVLIGGVLTAVVIEDVQIGSGSVVAAGAIVTQDVQKMLW